MRPQSVLPSFRLSASTLEFMDAQSQMIMGQFQPIVFLVQTVGLFYVLQNTTFSVPKLGYE